MKIKTYLMLIKNNIFFFLVKKGWAEIEKWFNSSHILSLDVVINARANKIKFVLSVFYILSTLAKLHKTIEIKICSERFCFIFSFRAVFYIYRIGFIALFRDLQINLKDQCKKKKKV